MKLTWFHFIAFVTLAHAHAWAQQPSHDSSTNLAYENGGITNNVYTNECFGFSFVIPVGWEVNTQLLGAEGKAKHAAGQLALLMLDQHKEGSFGNRIVVLARETGSVPTAEEFVSKSAHGQVDLDRERRQMVKDTYPTNYGGKIFFRADYRQAMSNGDTLYDAFVYTKFRGYYIGETIIAGSPEGLELGASSLQGVSFQDDKPDPKCLMSADESPNAGGVMGGVLSSKPPQPNIATPWRVRISSGVAVGLLIKKVPPDYPDLAKQERVQGQVILLAEIDENGNVEHLKPISGDSMLATAAVEAVKQWKYKPYLLNGQPVKVETQVIVNFQLAAR